MGLIASSTTVYSVAYLTNLGREYLFDSKENPRYITLDNGQTIDRFKIERFTLGDPDVNYQIPFLLESGQIPDVSGENETSLKGALNRTLSNLISPGDTNLPKDDINLVEYKTTNNRIIVDLKKALDQLQTVYAQQLMTFIDGALINEASYDVTPTNYGKNKVKNGELVITLQDATATEAGYRLRIFYPTTGGNYNKMTFQFEKSPALQPAIVQNVTTQSVTAAPTTTTTSTITNNITTSGTISNLGTLGGQQISLGGSLG
jgi:hypothetical protein